MDMIGELGQNTVKNNGFKTQRAGRGKESNLFNMMTTFLSSGKKALQEDKKNNKESLNTTHKKNLLQELEKSNTDEVE
eukprot:CAMPEP_0205806180 /NCGR_PEP_ID=MMETSP0205-20121125/9620_1 /ASSEMBLY_ACC=CAM_ASM_000278 /TAXON_ID=36767 /ORGANISM="Euplotes focardii, Strain TN1" /LENGTH=77 /DNA_ID=CAMNT_0053078573 /DNA_START=834 /DNA_END=1067 /DNA_ORIENTATION=+